jgi:RES domain-containing protein
LAIPYYLIASISLAVALAIDDGSVATRLRVMDVWRLASRRHDPLSGEGARRVGGRWGSPGRAVVYASDSMALALVEALVHVTGPLPLDYRAFHIEVLDSEIERLDFDALKGSWSTDIGYTRAIGDQWLEQRRSVALVVPGAVLPVGSNVLDPAHPRTGSVRVIGEMPFAFNPRLRGAS